MKIKSITIENYRGIKNQRINPDRINMLTGKCGSGKSSVLDAIRFAFVGKADRNDINVAGHEASVTVEFEDGTSFSRIRKNDGTNCKCNGKTVSAKALEEFLISRTGVSATVFDSMSNVDFFGALNKRDMTEFFLNVLPLQITFDKMIELIDMNIIAPVSAAQRDYLSKLFPGNGMFGLKEIEVAYKSEYDQRTKLNAQLKAVSARCEFDEKTLPKETKDQLEKALYALAKLEADIGNQKKIQQAYDTAVKNREKAEKQLIDLKETYKAYESLQKPDATVYERLKSQKEKGNQAVSNSQQAIAALKSNTEVFVRTLKNLDKPVCPISEKLICTTDKTGIRQELTQLVQKNQEVIKKHQEYIQKCFISLKKIDVCIEKYTKDLVEYGKKENLEKQIRNFILPQLPEKPKEIESDQTDYQQRKVEINRKLSVITAYENVLKFRKEKAQLEKDLALCEFAVSSLDVKYGVRMMIVKKALAPIENVINQKADRLRKNLSLKFECEDGIEILVSPQGTGNYIAMNKVSTGEAVCVGYLLMSAVQAISNSKYMVIDNLDRLDSERLHALLTLLETDVSSEHIFLGAVDHDDINNLVKEFKDIKHISM